MVKLGFFYFLFCFVLFYFVFSPNFARKYITNGDGILEYFQGLASLARLSRNKIVSFMFLLEITYLRKLIFLNFACKLNIDGNAMFN